MVASDYKFRVRAPTDTLSGGVDAFVLLEIGVYGCVATYIVVTLRGLPHLTRLHPALFLCSGYVLMLALGAAYSPYRSLAAVRAVETLVLLGLVLKGAATAGRAELHWFAHAFLALVVASVLYGIVRPTATGYPLQVGRFTWLQLHPITAGVYVGLASLIGLAYTVTARRPRPGPQWSVSAYGLATALVLYGLIGTKTRNAVLGAAVGAVVLLCALYKGRRRLDLGLAALVIVPLVALTAAGALTVYFARGEDPAELATLNSRTSLWATAIAAIRLQPMFGYGLSASRGLFLDATGLGGGHNAFINVAVDLGLVGLLVWVSWLLSLIRAIWWSRTAAGDGGEVDRAVLLGLLAFLLVDGFFFEGLGATSNVAGDFLFFITVWAVVLTRAPARAPGPVRALPRRQVGAPR